MSLLRTEAGVRRVQEALREHDFDGWLLYEFHGLNPIAATMLGTGKTTRRGFAFVPREGEPVALIHAIEQSAWRDWPFAVRTYRGWREMEASLASLLEGCGRIAMEVSPGAAVPTLDLVPAGIAGLILESGVELVASGDLVTRFHSVWTPDQRDDHRRAAEIVSDVAHRAFERAAEHVRAGAPTSEGALSLWILDALRAAGLVHETGCIVAVGPCASDPHYAPAGEGHALERGQLVLIDLWGGFEGSVPADQTWMGALASSVDARTEEVWRAVRDARDAALAFFEERFRAGAELRGFEVDDVARAVISDRGFEDRFVHRTGHSIDVALHGSGPNLDNLESRDDRLLVEGVGFSVEPGIYIPGEIGVRSEVNVHWTATGPEVTPARIQRDLLLLLDD